MKIQKQISIKQYRPSEGFISRYQKLIREVVIPYQYDVLCDKAEGAEKSHVVQNFINAAAALRGEDVGDGFYGMVFQDSDAAKWLEAVGYSLAVWHDPKLEETADSLIDIIAAAQDEDGYLNTYFTIKDRDKRWKNLLEGHELYCAGHFMEAAVAYYNGTGKDKLLKVMLKNMEHIYKHFITEKHEGYPGHPEVELALLKLYRATGEKHCLELAEHFINARGENGGDFYKREKALRDWTVWGNNAEDGAYQQSFAPVREQSDAVGHSVRAVYLYTAMADLASETDDGKLLEACRRLWNSIADKRMYITGGIGSTGIGEAFTVDYDLPNDTAYAETCASCGLMFFASRMLEACPDRPDGKYGDIMERAFYNTVLAGMQLDGKRFFYVNPLEVIPGVSGIAATHWHDKPQRPEWFVCACCPPNVARTIAAFGTYAYGEGDRTAYCHLYASGEVDFSFGLTLRCETDFPYGFTVKYTAVRGNGTAAVRIPAWSESTAVSLNGEKISPRTECGYAYVDLSEGDVLEIALDDRARVVYSSAKVAENTGCAAIQRGALVYCFEGVDNGGDVLSLVLDDSGEIAAGEAKAELGGAVTLTAKGYRTAPTDSLYSFEKPKITAETLTAVPYYTWGNRGENQMRVWLPYRG
ncbi:MAG: glycoside hydrolase family 127 protein [Oscillospiraceae bacterium]|nr:glycoside hydrolase family 127 protein [Oscillospiraceae bacterium]